MQQKSPFDLENYKSLLKKCKGKKPEKIFDLLNKEPDPLLQEGS
jgi:predicted unusual protein kinase regulating ubiquinone biosynthesis (AarF/ABC1/UbiB family)